jgi:threonine dehydrogenase-like Zn-dependent dehydrogenase
MTAAALLGARSISVTRRPVPEPEPGEVRVRIDTCGLCGSDLHFFHMGPVSPGNTPGHEMAGCVDAVGDGVEGLAPGDRVAVEPLASCGRCDYCRTGRDSICPSVQLFGVHRPGGFAEFATLPARRLFRIPVDLDPIIAALTEPMAVAVHGLRQGQLQAGQRVLVLGAGTVGLLTAKAAVALGAGEVWLTARHPHQAEVGQHLGATRVLREEEASRADLFRLGAEAPIDLVVETVGGTADTLRSAAAAVRPGGVISVLGIFYGDVSLDTLQFFLKENTLTWSNCYSRPADGADFAVAVELVGQHRDELAQVTTHQVPLADVARAFALAGDKKAGAVKVTVVP